jgi:AAHS family benzoate transporter-like MFS transporter
VSQRQPLKVFFICWVAYATSQMDLALFGYALPSILEEWNLDRGDLRWILFCSFAGGGIVLVWLGTLTDRLGRKRMLVGSILVSSGVVAGHSLVAGPIGLAALRGAAVATGGLTYPVSGAMVTEVAPARWRGIYAGLLQTGYPAGWFLAAMFAAPLLSTLGWRLLFLVGLISIPYAWVVHKLLRESQRFKTQQPETLAMGSRERIAMLLRPPYRRRTITLFCAQFLFVLAYGGTALLFPLYFIEQRGFSIGSSAALVGLGNAISIIGYLGAALVGEFLLSRRNTVVVWTLAGGMGFLWLVWGTEGYTDSLLAFGLMSIFFYGAAAVKFAFVAEVFPTELRATGLALASSLAVTLGTATGPVLVLTAVDRWGWDIAFSLFGAIPLFLAGVFYLFLTPVPSGIEVEEVQLHLAESRREL